MDKPALAFFEALSNASGPSGFEREPLALVRKYVENYCDAMDNDRMGSLLFTKHGKRKGPVVMLAGHCDEIGFLITALCENGFIQFAPLGGWPPHVVLGQRVKVMTKGGLLPGLVAAKPIHLMSEEERGKLVKLDKMFIDVGCTNLDELKAIGVRVGDAIVPDSTYSTWTVPRRDGDEESTATLAMGKAFDNRAGTFAAAEAVRRLAKKKIAHPNTVVGAATVQEEVGLRGATTAGYMANPDVALSLDVDIARDVPGVENPGKASGLGKGVSISTYDRSMIPNQALKELAIETAEAEGIPYHLTAMTAGGQDGGMIHKGREGCPTLYLGVPARHIHSHVGLLDLDDMEQWVRLVVAIVKRLDAATVASLTKIG